MMAGVGPESMPADELLQLAEAHITRRPDDDWKPPKALHDRDHWAVYVMADEFDIPPHPGPAHEWPPTLVADLREARYAVAYAARRRERTDPRRPVERALAPAEAKMWQQARGVQAQIIRGFLAQQGRAATGGGGRRR